MLLSIYVFIPLRHTSSRIWLLLGMLGKASTELLCLQPGGGGCPPALSGGQSFWRLRPSRAPAAGAALQKPNPRPFPLCQAFRQIIDIFPRQKTNTVLHIAETDALEENLDVEKHVIRFFTSEYLLLLPPLPLEFIPKERTDPQRS